MTEGSSHARTSMAGWSSVSARQAAPFSKLWTSRDGNARMAWLDETVGVIQTRDAGSKPPRPSAPDLA